MPKLVEATGLLIILFKALTGVFRAFDTVVAVPFNTLYTLFAALFIDNGLPVPLILKILLEPDKLGIDIVGIRFRGELLAPW